MASDDEAGKLFVGGLSWDTTQESLLKFFSKWGEVCDCVVMKNQTTGKSRGFGFVTYKDPDCVKKVFQTGTHVLDGRTIDPKVCNPRHLNQAAANKNRKVFIGGIPPNIEEDDLKEFFSRYGNVADVSIMFDQEKKRSRGFGFMSFEQEDVVDMVCQEHYFNINGKQIEVKRAEPRDGKNGLPLSAGVLSPYPLPSMISGTQAASMLSYQSPYQSALTVPGYQQQLLPAAQPPAVWIASPHQLSALSALSPTGASLPALTFPSYPQSTTPTQSVTPTPGGDGITQVTSSAASMVSLGGQSASSHYMAAPRAVQYNAETNATIQPASSLTGLGLTANGLPA
ncbi:unnamed protein product, partial [Owenia fusiformis]